MLKRKNRILIISQYFPPDISGGGTRAFNYAKCLMQQNYDVTVITAFPHLHGKITKEYKNRLVKREKIEEIEIIRVYVPSLLHTSSLKRIILHFSFIISSLLPIFSIKPDIIFASEPNLFSIIPSYIYSKIRGGNVIRVVDDLWPEVIYERNYVKSRIIKKILDWLARFSYSYPKVILPLTNEAKNHIKNNYGIKEEKIVVIEHGIDKNIFKASKKSKEDKFVVMYSGALVESYDFNIIINAAEKLKDEKIEFIIRGKGILLDLIKQRKKELNLENLLIDDAIVPFSEISSILKKADVFLIPMKDEYTLNLSLPTKILEYQAIGRPIICCSNGAPGNFIKNTKSGIRVNYGDVDEFVKSILMLKDNQDLCVELGQRGRKFVEENLFFDKIGIRLTRIIQDILNQKK
jgi:glycosyltransferase involved in cell wall biosynthesis